MSHRFSDERVIDERGTVELLYTELDAQNNPIRSFPMVVQPRNNDADIDELAKDWIEANSANIAPFMPPDMDALKNNARADLLFRLETLTQKVTSKYLSSDQIRWLAKEVEAKTFLSMPEGERSIEHAPEVAPGIMAANPDLSEAELLRILNQEMQDIQTNAERFRAINTFTEKVRKENHPLIEVATSEQQLVEILAAAEISINEFAAVAGI